MPSVLVLNGVNAYCGVENVALEWLIKDAPNNYHLTAVHYKRYSPHEIPDLYNTNYIKNLN